MWDDSKDKTGIAEIKTKPRLYTIKYKHDPDGNLLQMRVLRDDGKEMETASYNLKAKTVTRRYETYDQFIREFAPIGTLKMVSTLDANGHSIEDAYQVMSGTTHEQTFDYSRLGGFTFFDNSYQHYRTDKQRHEYKFDHRGNWIQRKTFFVNKNEQRVFAVTYRTITYYQ